MARTNVAKKSPAPRTHEGAVAARINPYQQLRRSVASCFLFEDEFYEDGQSIADRIAETALKCEPEQVADLAVEARSSMNLRHVPLLLLSVLSGMAKGAMVSRTIEKTIQRADELAEFLAIHAKRTGKPVKKAMTAQIRKGLARAFAKFDANHLAKYNRDGAIKLRDVLFLSHAKPSDDAQAAVWKQLVDGTLPPADTWEVALSGGADKKEAFTRLLKEKKLGYLALLRNLRNMAQAGVDDALVRAAIIARKGGAERVLPFRYTAAARACPQFEPALDEALCEAISGMPVLDGLTVVMVDVSGSMDAALSAKSDLTRADAAATLASIIPGQCRVFSFSNSLVEVPARKGMAGVDAVLKSQHHSGTQLIDAIRQVNAKVKYDRIIVISDEQAASDKNRLPDPNGKGYMINVASAKNGIGYGKWTHIDGFSESVLRFIGEIERDAD